jgi:EpsD family peptidyl-prolyl cis-trans isomerase
MNASVSTIGIALAVGLLLAGCGKDKALASSQVAATVNQREISVHQLNFALQQRPDLAQLGDAAAPKALDDLINQEVVVQAAIDAKIDRDPNVLLALEAARRDILSRTYLERTTESATKPSPADVTRYYNEQPALFKARRVYQLLEHDIEVADDKIATLEAQVTPLKTPQAVAQFIAASGLKFQSGTSTRVPEAIPLELLTPLSALAEGQTVFVKQPRGVRALTLVSSLPAPVSEAQARPAIEQFLLNRERAAAAEAQVKALRGKAEVASKLSVAQKAP